MPLAWPDPTLAGEPHHCGSTLRVALTALSIPARYFSSLCLTGETRDRASVLEAFARGDAPVFRFGLKAGDVGLTLTEADTVILVDAWYNPAVERQAVDRAHRIGQTKPVFVHRLVAAGRVDDKSLELQARKQALAEALFEENADSGLPILDEVTLQDFFAPLNG